MASTLSNRIILAFGGTGSIGSAVVCCLCEHGFMTLALSSSNTELPQNLSYIQSGNKCQNYGVDVTADYSLDELSRLLVFPDFVPRVHGIVYMVGRCPRAGFDNAVATPITLLPVSRLYDELELHVEGLLNVIRQFYHCLAENGHVVVITSAITRLTDEQCPPWLHAGHYAAAKAAQDELIRWLRRDPNLRARNILVHRIAPAAVDTPFHEGCVHRPPALIPVDVVADEVLRALQGTEIVDKILLPQ